MTSDPTQAPAHLAAPSHKLPNSAIVILRGVAGGIAGGAIGFFVFQWLARQGMYGMMIPGAAIGLGAGLAAGGRSVALGVLCAIAAVGLSIFAEWYRPGGPFRADPSFLYFLTHLHQLDSAPMKFIMMGLGTAFAYWLGQGR